MRKTRTRILYLPILFYPEPWNGIMERMCLVIRGLPREEFEPIIAVGPNDGAQTLALAQRTGARTVPLSSSLSVREFAGLCRSGGIDMVHIHTPVTGGVPRAALAASLGGVASILITYHGVQVKRLSFKSRFVNRVSHRLLIDHAIAGSGGIAATLAARCGLERQRIEVILYGVAPAPEGLTLSAPLLSRREGEIWIGYVGRLAAEKGLTHLIEALALLRPRCPQARVVLIGDGYERAALEAKVDALNLGGVVTFAGHRTDVRACMREIDVLVLPSLIEGLGLVLLEAMDAARPVVATRAPGGIPEVVQDGVTGLLVPPGDPVALSSALEHVVTDGNLRASMGVRGHERFLQFFQGQRMVDGELAAYHRLSRDRRAQGWQALPRALLRRLRAA